MTVGITYLTNTGCYYLGAIDKPSDRYLASTAILHQDRVMEPDECHEHVLAALRAASPDAHLVWLSSPDPDNILPTETLLRRFSCERTPARELYRGYSSQIGIGRPYFYVLSGFNGQTAQGFLSVE